MSTGVHLTTYAALRVARSINTCLRNNADDPNNAVDEQQCFEVRPAMRRICPLLSVPGRLLRYQSQQGIPTSGLRNMLNSKEQGNGAFVKLISGVADGMLHDNAAGFFDSRADTGMRVQSWMSAMQGDVQHDRVRTTVDDYSDSTA
ncbi:MAG: hypothetical protein R2867_26410 [Caldilineaceae bacterium]